MFGLRVRAGVDGLPAVIRYEATGGRRRGEGGKPRFLPLARGKTAKCNPVQVVGLLSLYRSPGRSRDRRNNQQVVPERLDLTMEPVAVGPIRHFARETHLSPRPAPRALRRHRQSPQHAPSSRTSNATKALAILPPWYALRA